MNEEILGQMRADREGPGLQTLEAYMLAFSGREEEVARAWRRMNAEQPSGVDLEPASEDVPALGALADPDAPRLTPKGEIARGGMGVVYEVRDEVLRRDLAMKKVTLASLPAGSTSGAGSGSRGSLESMPLLVRRLLEEAQVTAQLDHSGVVPVHELGIDDEGHLFFTMKRVRGRTLSEVFELVRSQAGSWSLSRALGVFLKMCETLAYAHAKGVIHRDLKPANIMVGRFGEVYVMDWGLAKVHGREAPLRKEAPARARSGIVQTDQSKLTRRHESAALTMHGDVVGTLGYMPPEQAMGELDTLDARADVYSLGAMLYDLVAGHAPYREPEAKRNPAQLLAAITHDAPKPVSACAPEAPPELIAIIGKAMARAPDERFPSAEALADELHAFLDGRVVRAHKAGVWIEVRKWVGRNRALAGAVAAGLLLLIGGTIAFTLQQHAAMQAIARERDAADRAAARERAERRVADGLRLCAESQVLNNADPALALALAIEGADRAPGVNANNALYAALRKHRQYRDFSGHELYVGFGRFTTPDGGWLLTGDDGGLLVLWDVQGGEARYWIDTRGDAVVDAAITGDGTLAVTAHRDGSVRVIDLARGTVRHTLLEASEETVTLSMTSGGDRLFVARASGVVERYDPRAGVKREDLTRHDGAAWISDLHPGGTRLVSMGEDGRIQMLDASTGKRLWARAADEGTSAQYKHGAVEAHFAGNRVVVRFPDGTAQIIDTETGATRHPLGAPYEILQQPLVSGDGRRVAFLVSGKQQGALLRVVDVSSGRVVAENAWPGSGVLGLSPDGRHALLARGFDVEVRDVASGEVRLQLLGHRYRMRAATFSPDGRRIASMCADRVVRVWHGTADFERRALVPQKRGQNALLAMSADGAHAFLSEGAPGMRTFPLSVMDTRTGTSVTIPGQAVGGHLAARFTPDGETVLRFTVGGRVRAYDTRTGKLRFERKLPDKGVVTARGAARFSPDGRRLALRRTATTFDMYELDEGTLLSTVGTDCTQALDFAWSMDGSRFLVANGRDGVARLYDVVTGETRATLEGHTGYVMHVAFDPTGRTVATTAVDSSVRIWDAETGVELRQARGLPMRGNPVAFSPDGRLVAVSSTSIHLFRADEGETCQPVATLERGPDLHALAFHPDGRQFWTTDAEWGVRLWGLDARRQAIALQVRPITPAEMAEYDIGDEAERAAYSRQWDAARTDSPGRLRRAVQAGLGGDPEAALAALQAIEDERPGWPRVFYERARVLGRRAQEEARTEAQQAADRAACLRALEDAVVRGWAGKVGFHLLLTDDAFAPVRSDSRYRSVLVDLGLAEGD